VVATSALLALIAGFVPPGNTPVEAGAAADAAGARPRFFFYGDGVIDLKNFHTGEEQHVRFRDSSGRYSPEALDRLMTLFRSRGDNRTADVSLRLIELLDYVEDHFKPREMLLMSGYRSPEYNAQIRDQGAQAAKSSLHTEGLAADIRFVGLDQHALWLGLRALDCCGTGYYKTGEFIHLDVGRPRFWEETTSRVGENLSAGNARVFARTDFDRYETLPGAVVSLHSVTLRPLRVARRAKLVGESGSGEAGREVDLEPASGAADATSDCFVLAEPPATPPDRFVVSRIEATAAAASPHGAGKPHRERGRIVLRTCEPRLEATPETIETNLVELGG
jgi:uncharacterized protein YcbK (DUF882 family)